MSDGLVNTEEIRCKTLVMFFTRTHSFKINILVVPFLPYKMPFFSQ